MKLFILIASILMASPNFVFAHETSFDENNSLVKAGGKYVTLLGTQINVGDIAPNFKVVDHSFSPIELKKFEGKNVLISVVPSLDTGICSVQTKKFNQKITSLPADTVFITISNDLPFAQKRFCTTENINSIEVLSDAVWRDFGTKYGLVIKDMGLLTRAIFIINTANEVIYKELVSEVSKQPNYDEAFKQISALSASKIK